MPWPYVILFQHTFVLNQQFKAKFNNNKENLACWYICYIRYTMEIYVCSSSPHKLDLSVHNSRAEEKEAAVYMAYQWRT